MRIYQARTTSTRTCVNGSGRAARRRRLGENTRAVPRSALRAPRCRSTGMTTAISTVLVRKLRLGEVQRFAWCHTAEERAAPAGVFWAQRRLPFTAAWKKGRGEIGTGEHPHPGTGASEHKRTWPWFLASGQIGGAGEGLGAGEVGNARTVNCARATSKVQEDPHPVCFPHGPHLNPAADPRTPKRGLSETGAVDSTPAHSPAAKELPLTPSVTRGSSHGTLTLHTSRSTRHPVEARAEKIPHSLIPLYVSKGENSHVHEPQR